MAGLAPGFDLLQSHWPVQAATDEAAHRILNVVAPFDGELVAQVTVASERAVQDALFAAFSMFRQKDRWLSSAQRIAVLERAHQLVNDNAELLAQQSACETGKALRFCEQEVEQVCTDARAGIVALQKGLSQVFPVASFCGLQPNTRQVRFEVSEPVGVVVVVLGQANSLQLAAQFLFAAVVAGCPIIIKPAATVPLAGLRLVHLLHEAGLPYVWCQSVVTETRDVTAQLVSDPRVALFSFSGSADVGWQLRSQLAPGTRAQLDHGSVAPAIVALDADLNAVTEAVVSSGLIPGVFDSESIQRVFVPHEICDALLLALVERVDRIVSGNPTLPSTEVGPLARDTDLQRVQDWVDAAVKSGGRLVCGGYTVGRQGYAPTILLNPALDAKISTQHAYAPLLAIYSVGSMEEACERANSLPFARTALVFTGDPSLMTQMSRTLDATHIVINPTTSDQISQPTASGLRRSGLGERGFTAACAVMQVQKSVDHRAWIAT